MAPSASLMPRSSPSPSDLDTLIIAMLDERHFRAVRPLTAETAFRLLPADR